MKASIILASLITLAVASPLARRDDCVCEIGPHTSSWPASCEYEAKVLAECTSTLSSTCVIPKVSKPCQDHLDGKDSDAIPSASVSIATGFEYATATSVPSTPTVSASATPQVCGGIIGTECPAGLTCVPDAVCGTETADCQGKCHAQF